MRELPDRWVLPIADCSVTRCCVDHSFTIELMSQGCANATIRIGESFELRSPDGESWRLRPQEGPTSLTPALAMLGRTVSHAEAKKDGTLDVAFTDGSSLRVPPDANYEAWEFAGTQGAKIVSMPGGDIAVWRPAA